MTEADDDEPQPDGGLQRLDKWLWFARVLKSRTLAATAVSEGKVRVNKVRAAKPAQMIKPGDVLTIALREKVLILKMVLPGVRRGPPPEARTLYEDLTASSPPRQAVSGYAQRQPGARRPSKRDRRLINELKGRT